MNTANNTSNREDLLSQKKQLKSLNDYKVNSEKNLSSFISGLATGRLEDYYRKQRQKEETEAEYRERRRKEEDERSADRNRKAWNALYSGLSAFTNSITGSIDSSLDKYVKAQQALAAHLQGSNNTLSTLTDRLQSALSTTNIVKQEDVFKNVTDYVKSGIVYNVEQRAFLKTLTEDIALEFSPEGSLNQLIRVQMTDSTANRIALTYSLQEFLNQNYQTSEYIVKSFTDVSNSLKDALSTMNASQSTQLEATIQTYLGSMYSAGMNSNTISSLASALNALGSGDISNLGSGISNLVLMGAARAGLDYGAILNEGLTSGIADRLLAGITSYMQEMGSNQSNVVQSQLGKLFGVGITDIRAAQNLRQTSGSVSTNINELFSDYGSFVPFSTGLQNTVSNILWSFGTNIAENQGLLMSYEISKLIANSGLGQMLFSMGNAIKAGDIISRLSGSAVQLAGLAISNAQLIPILSSLFLDGGIQEMFGNIAERSSAAALYAALGSGRINGSTVKVTGAGTSGGMYVSSTGINDLLSGSTSSLNDFTSQVVTIDSEDEGPTLEENVITITETIVEILDLLTDKLDTMDSSLADIASNSLSTGWSDVTHFSI